MVWSPDAMSSAGVLEVEPRHRIDEAALDRWMRSHVQDYDGPLSVMRFSGGQSNPTYRLQTPGKFYVLRRKPFGELLPSAHAIDREFRVMSALHSAGFAVPRTYALCEDASVIGAAFYIMEQVEGVIHWDPMLPELAPDLRSSRYRDMISALAGLHSIDHVSIGLGDFGQPGNYFERQVKRWTKQYRSSETTRIEAFEALIEWLPNTLPEQRRTSIVHGDFRIDNLIFSTQSGRVQAVLDWELSTLGDPLADFSYLLMGWIIPGSPRAGMSDTQIREHGLLTEAEALELYCRHAGIEQVPSLHWYCAFNMFRLAGIAQGIVKRARDGNAANARAEEVGAKVPMLANAAWEFAKRAGA